MLCILARSLGFQNAAVSEKTPHMFRPLSDAEYAVSFVERLIRGQTDTHNYITLAANARAPWVKRDLEQVFNGFPVMSVIVDAASNMVAALNSSPEILQRSAKKRQSVRN